MQAASYLETGWDYLRIISETKRHFCRIPSKIHRIFEKREGDWSDMSKGHRHLLAAFIRRFFTDFPSSLIAVWGYFLMCLPLLTDVSLDGTPSGKIPEHFPAAGVSGICFHRLNQSTIQPITTV
jgi:hypothetical protein